MKKGPKAYQRFFAELKRRRVFNTAALYGGAAFVVFQAADFVVPALRLGDSVATAIVLIAVCGFPIAMALAWMFNLSWKGVTLTHPAEKGELDAIVAQPASRRWPVGLAAAAGILLLLGGFGWHFADLGGARLPNPMLGAEPIGSIAVFPFLDLISGEDASYLGAGIANELSEGLRRVPGLRVLGMTSAFTRGDGGLDLTSVAKQLGVTSLLEGSVGVSGDTVMIAARIVSPNGGDEGWTRHYRLSKTGFLTALDQVAKDIAAEIGAEGFGSNDEPLILPSTEDFDAFCDYLRGRQLSHLSTPAALQEAIGAYHRALLLDPTFSPAWSALATAYLLLPDHGGPSSMDIVPYAQAALDNALTSGSGMPEGYSASGYLKWAYLWDLPGAESDFRRSIELDPTSPISRFRLAQTLTSLRRWDEALEQAELALELDPWSPVAHMTLGMVLFCAGREGGEEALLRGLEIAPEMHPAAFVLGMLLAMEGDLEGAAAAFHRFSSLTGTDPMPFHAYLEAVSDSSKVSDAVSALQGPGFFGPTQGAALLAHLGQTESALQLLEEAAEARSTYLVWANALPQFNKMRGDPRLQGILAWVGY